MKHSASPKPRGETARRASCAGFSLIEMLAALAIAGAMVAVVSEFAGRAMRNWNRGEQTVAAMEMVTRAVERLSIDLSQVLPMTAPNSDGARVLFAGTPDHMQFMEVTGFTAGNNGIELIDIAVIKDNDGTTLVRRRGPPVFPATQLRDPVTLARGRLQVRLTYADRDGTRSERWIDKADFPASVVVEFLDAGGAQLFAVPVVLPVVTNYSVECVVPGNADARPAWCDVASGFSPGRAPRPGGQTQTPPAAGNAPNPGSPAR